VKIRSDDEESDYALFGKIVLLWGLVEMSLVNIALRLSHPLFIPKCTKNFPSSFDKLMEFAYKRYATLPEMIPIASEAKTILDTLPPLHATRTIIVHGQYQGYHYKDSYMFGFYHSRRSDQKRFSIKEMSTEQLHDTLKRISAADKEMERLSRATFLIEPPKAIRAVKRSSVIL
jgi:hypothetical protein